MIFKEYIVVCRGQNNKIYDLKEHLEVYGGRSTPFVEITYWHPHKNDDLKVAKCLIINYNTIIEGK